MGQTAVMYTWVCSYSRLTRSTLIYPSLMFNECVYSLKTDQNQAGYTLNTPAYFHKGRLQGRS